MEKALLKHPSAEKMPELLTDVMPVEEGSVGITKREDIKRVIEIPLQSACEELYDKNIETWMSSANKKDIVTGQAYILIIFDSLSERNKEIARRFAEPKMVLGRNIVRLTIPVSEKTTIGDIQNAAHEIVSQFEKQSMTWTASYSVSDMRAIIGDREETFSIEDLQEGSGYYYDNESQRFYLSEEQFRKTRA